MTVREELIMDAELTLEQKLRLAMLRYREALTLSAAAMVVNGHVVMKRGAYEVALKKLRGQYTEDQLRQALIDVTTASGNKTEISVPGMIIEVRFTGELTLPELLHSLEEAPSSPVGPSQVDDH